MNNDEMNKKMEFIVEQQAKFAADIEVMREVHEKDTKLLKDGLIGLVHIVGSLTHAQMRTEESVNQLAAAHLRTEESIKLLTQAQGQTDERLNNLINVVERHISGNGGAENRA
jgi:hypothetical protein